ncbi:MAG: hypothetical protein AAFO69_04940, partial [Bacteroidota bacterium]
SGSVEVTGFDQNDLISTWPSIDGRESWDNDVEPSDFGCEIQVRITNDDPNASPTWTAWQPLIVGDYSARAFEFRVKLTSNIGGVTPSISSLSVTVDMPDRIESGDDITFGTVSFNAPFRAVPSIAVTGQNMQVGDYFEVTSKTASGFTVSFYASDGSPVTRTFDYIASGYGLQST